MTNEIKTKEQLTDQYQEKIEAGLTAGVKVIFNTIIGCFILVCIGIFGLFVLAFIFDNI